MGLTKAGLNSGVVVISSGHNRGILLYLNVITCGEKSFLVGSATFMSTSSPITLVLSSGFLANGAKACSRAGLLLTVGEPIRDCAVAVLRDLEKNISWQTTFRH